MLYYPGFEAKNVDWLKFALLYLDDLQPIIPSIPGDKTSYLNDTTIKIMNETNFIRKYSPSFQEGTCASQLAMIEFDNYLRSPNIYAKKFGYGYNNANILYDNWHNTSRQNYTLFEGKYSDDFYQYCIEEKIAHPCNEGIKINEDLAYIYMSFLAEVISQANGLEAITDSQKYNNLILVNNNMLSKSVGKQIEYAKNNIEINLPINIHNIPIEQFISLRSSRDFNQLRTAYMNEIKALIVAKEKHDEGYSFENLLSYKKDFIMFCQESFNMICSATLAAYGICEIANNNLSGLTLLNTLASIGLNTGTLLKNNPLSTFKNISEKRLARKYVATLRGIIP